VDKPGLSRAERDYLNVLGALVHEYEERTVSIPPLDGVELVRELLKERGLRQKDLAPAFGTESIVSAVLNGRREMNKRHIQALARFFQVSPAAFFAEVGRPASSSRAA
jgi:HTH-type transcriptional regulator/antitoxin HigA